VAAQTLPQLYRYCFLITGDAARAHEVFQDTVREAAFHSANGEPPPDRFWFFREARWRCQAVSAQGLQPESIENELADISPNAPEQIAQLEPEQLAAWISAAPEPQRSVLALFYLNKFSYREIMSILGIKLPVLVQALTNGRREFQAWLNVAVPTE
jgi:DNA-directed RNA polymerase specialized sigma24 family protein